MNASACRRVAVLGFVLALGGAACGGDDDGAAAAPVIDPGDGGHYAPEIDPANFVTAVDNPYFPLPPGARWEYEGSEDGEAQTDVVEVTDEQRTVMGVPVVVVRDTVSAKGVPTEDTRDWYAQDAEGNVWYFGEDVRNFENGKLQSSDGSWEAGVDGALPGIIMPAHPKVGDAYRQEYDKGKAEDLGKILRVGRHKDVTAGSYDNVIVTRDWNPLEPDVIEEKSYAPGVGVVYERTVQGGDETSQLTSMTE
ncbi:MAG TPA: hypothetical protein VFX21_10245 [Acidimicrobiia bacterium]|nr:hypothetical protein [Acidimicrobiia bacterium]